MKFKLITALLVGAVCSLAAIADTLSLKKDHPQTYTVVKGDTLWDISSYFLNSPWLWPRLWQANSQVENPHLIYPGDVLTLIWVDGVPRLTRKKMVKLSPTPRLAEKHQPIPTIPMKAISAFLSRDHVIDPELIATAPRLLGDSVATPRFFQGDIFYAEGQYDDTKLYGVYRLDNDFIDPQSNEFLGKQLTFIGHSEVSQSLNVSSTEQVTPHDFLNSSREARQGDLILAIPETETWPAFLIPQSVPVETTGQMLSGLNRGTVVGKWDTVVINKGHRENIQIGSMFSILQSGPNVLTTNDSVSYQKDGNKFDQMGKPDVVIPAQRVGELMVFKVYEKVSIALILRSKEVMKSNYKIQGLEF